MPTRTLWSPTRTARRYGSSDVANIIDGTQNTKLGAWMNTVPAVILNIQRQPGANVIAVTDRIRQMLPQLASAMPAAVDVAVLTDRTVTIRSSVHDVEFELMLAVVLVVLVIFVFIRSTRATLIPSLSVPLSLVGTFGAMYLLGFSLNNLSLMALTISTGFVVDDAIVVIENIARYIEEGESPLQAALRGSEQIGFTIISLTISLIAVLIPLLFMADVVGRLFREFAITLSVTILISAVVSLTLVPMACAKLLRPAADAHETRFQRRSREWFDKLIDVVRSPAQLGSRPADFDPVGCGRHPGPDRRALCARFRRASSRCRTPASSRAFRRRRNRSRTRPWPNARASWQRSSLRIPTSKACPRSLVSTAPIRRSTAAVC